MFSGVLVGINLLREGLDIPEITLVAILDADKEGFLRSEVSLIQTIGRAARNSEGHVIMYADTVTDSMRLAIDETERRRALQEAYNKEHGITPKTIQKSVRDLISISKEIAKEELQFEKDPESMSKKELEKLIKDIDKKMKKAAADLNFELAAELRDKMIELKKPAPRQIIRRLTITGRMTATSMPKIFTSATAILKRLHRKRCFIPLALAFPIQNLKFGC